MFTFEIKPSSIGNGYFVNGFPNDILRTVINNFIENQCPIIEKVNAALCNANQLNMDKTLSENKIQQGSIVLLISENAINKVPTNPNKNNNIFHKIPSPSNNIQLIQNNLFPPKNLATNNILKLNTFPNKNHFKKNNNNINNIITNNNFFINPQPSLMINQNFEPEEQKCINFLTKGCKIPLKMFDFEYNCVDNWTTGRKNGPPGYEKDYYPPIGWIGIGLKVCDIYDNGDNNWLETGNNKGEWYIAYHPIKTLNSILGILNNGFRRGPYQDCKDDNNLNPLTKNYKPKCGEGVYFIRDINETKDYTEIIEFEGDKFRVAFMCRLNPYKVRITEGELSEERWIVNGDKLNDPSGRKRDDEVRPYKILLFIEK